jgi:hypothetical protein
MSKSADPEVWQAILRDTVPAWVLFKHGTCVVVSDPRDDAAAAAIAILREHGPVHVATPTADFTVHTLADYPGWVISCHHSDIITYVHPREVDEPGPRNHAVGLLGRSYRDHDSRELEVVHLQLDQPS